MCKTVVFETELFLGLKISKKLKTNIFSQKSLMQKCVSQFFRKSLKKLWKTWKMFWEETPKTCTRNERYFFFYGKNVETFVPFCRCNIFWDRSNIMDSCAFGLGHNVPNATSSLGWICWFNKLYISWRAALSFIISIMCNLFDLALNFMKLFVIKVIFNFIYIHHLFHIDTRWFLVE